MGALESDRAIDTRKPFGASKIIQNCINLRRSATEAQPVLNAEHEVEFGFKLEFEFGFKVEFEPGLAFGLEFELEFGFEVALKFEIEFKFDFEFEFELPSSYLK